MAALVACSQIGLHTILIGRTGLGKTAAAMAFSRMNNIAPKKTSPHIISFNGETRLDELYGFLTIEKVNLSLHQGELSQAMFDGQVFIADELNLADQQIIQCENIILPVTGALLTIKEGFFFIGCQNDLTMNGRRPIPETIKKKILCIDYPEPTIEDLISLCSSILNQFNLERQIPICTASLMEEIRNDFFFKTWSLREVRILYKRIAYFKTKTDDFEGVTISSAIKGNERNDEWKNYKIMNLQFADNVDIYPFLPFSKSSSGGFSSLYYMSPLDVDDGNIVIDCGFSKLFFELTEEGIERYVKNIAVWMLQLEKKDIKYGAKKDARLVTAEKFEFSINFRLVPKIEFHQFRVKNTVNIVFLIDVTNSMGHFIKAVRDSCIEISEKCHKFKDTIFKCSTVAYRDTVLSIKTHQLYPKKYQSAV